MAGLLYVLPRPALLAFAEYLGRFGFYVVARQRNKTIENLRKAYGTEKTDAEIRRIACRVFEHITKTGAELLQFSKLGTEGVKKLVDAEKAVRVYNELLKEGRGLISMTAHIGNWELLAGAFGVRGYSGAVLARRIYYEPYNRWIVGLRQSVKVTTIYRDDASREILERLQKNEIIGLLPDQDLAGLKGIFVPFFGRPAYTAVAPVRMALSSGAPMLPNFLIRKPDNSYELIVGEVIRPVIKTTREEAVRDYTAEWMRQFEKVIRAYPEQWAWMHDRWKTQPAKKNYQENEVSKHL